MRILFLDIDGVLNSFAWVPPKEHDDIDPKAISLLNEIIAKSDAKVVIHSTWRRLRPLESLRTLFKRNGFTGDILDTTPVMYDLAGHAVPRGVHIQKWLDTHPEAGVTSFASLDDVGSMEHLSNRLIKTNMRWGLCPGHVEQVVKLLLEG